MRDETQSNKETWESGTKSALAGGVTVVVDQPNTIPPLTSPARIRERVFLAQSRAYTRFAINGAVTTDADLVGMWHAGVFAFGETFAGPSSYGDAVSADVLRRAMHQIAGFGGYMTIHAEQVREGNDCSLCAHDQLRPISGEVQTVRDILSLNTVCCNLYLCHLSSAEAIERFLMAESGKLLLTISFSRRRCLHVMIRSERSILPFVQKKKEKRYAPAGRELM
jgi:dihydroorotase